MGYLDRNDLIFLEYYKQFVMYNYINYKRDFDEILGMDYFTLERLYQILDKILKEENSNG